MDSPSEYRLWYNDYLQRLAKRNPEWKVLDIGKSEFWDYKRLWENYLVIDNNPSKNPDLTQDICASSLLGPYDLILCNGMYEYVDDTKRMVSEVYRLLENFGTAIFGFVGQDYQSYGANGKKWDKDMTIFEAFSETKRYDFGELYHYIICKKHENISE